MPKKFAAENSKAVAARDRKKAVKDAEVSKKQQQEEEERWRDDDKTAQKRQQKKEEQDRKREEQLAKKAEAKALLEMEVNSVKPKKAAAPPSKKVTRAQISSVITSQQKDVQKEDKKVVTHVEAPLEENINRLRIEGEEARTVDEAIGILSNNPDSVDKHPEKRMKAAYTAFEERRLQELKEENPSLRLSQLKQLIFKEWQKSPENPINAQ